MAPKTPPDKGTGKRSATKREQITPEQALKTVVDGLNLKIQQQEVERRAADEARNYAQLERDKLTSFWTITKEEVKELQALLRQKDRQAEEVEDKHQVEIKVYKQKVKHLLYVHQNDVSDLKVGTQEAVKAALDGCRAQQDALQEDKLALKQQLRDQRGEMEAATMRGRMGAARDLSRLRTEAVGAARDLSATYDAKLAAAREEIEARFRAAAAAAEEAKEAHIKKLMEEHGEANAALQKYYEDVLASSMDLVKTVKADAAELARREAATSALAHELAAENRRLKDPLEQAINEAAALKTRVVELENVSKHLATSQSRLAAVTKRVKELEWKNEVLEQRQLVSDTSSSGEGRLAMSAVRQVVVG